MNMRRMDRFEGDEWSKDFMRFLMAYRQKMEEFMNKEYSEFKNPFMLGDTYSDLIKQMYKDLNTESGVDADGEWEKKTWSSPDGSFHFESYSKSNMYEPKSKTQSETTIDTINLLEVKLRQAVQSENYEDAAKIRDLIKSLKDDSKDENPPK
jgi:hypothetical protein